MQNQPTALRICLDKIQVGKIGKTALPASYTRAMEASEPLVERFVCWPWSDRTATQRGIIAKYLTRVIGLTFRALLLNILVSLLMTKRMIHWQTAAGIAFLVD